MALKISVEPTEEPINLEEAKAHLRIDTEDEDGMILNLITVARQYAESVTGRALITQIWNYYLDDWPADKDYIEMPLPPLVSSTSIQYTDYNATVTTAGTSQYIVDTNSIPGKIVLAYGETWPTVTLYPSNPIKILFTCGYGTPDDIPESIKSAMKVDLSDLYEQRESIIVGQPGAQLETIERLYMPYICWSF